MTSSAPFVGGPGPGFGGPAVAALKVFSRRSGSSTSARVAETSQALAASSGGKSFPDHDASSSAAVPVLADEEVGKSGKQEPLVVNGKLNFRVRKRTQRALEGGGERKTGKTQDDSTAAAAATASPASLRSRSRLKSEGNNNTLRVINPEAAADVREAAGNLPSVVETTTRERRQSSRSKGGDSSKNQKAGVINKVNSAPATEQLSAVKAPRKVRGRGPTAKQSKISVNSEGISSTSELAELVLPAAGIATPRQDAAAPDFWHSSLSGASGVPIANSVVDAASILPVALVPRKTLTAPEDLAAALDHLKTADPLLKTVIEMHEGPKFQRCNSAFASLVRSIVFQQLATKAAAAIFGRLVTLCEGVENLKPTTISRLSAKELRAIGISERKASYLHDLAANFLSGVLSDTSMNEMDDDALMKALTAVKGIGVWSVHMFMLFSLHKADVLPVGDLGVRKGFQKLYQLKELPTPAEVERIASCWQPYRSLGSWYMWRVMDNVPPLKPIGD